MLKPVKEVVISSLIKVIEEKTKEIENTKDKKEIALLNDAIREFRKILHRLMKG